MLDTGVLIAIERGKLDIDTVLGADDASIATITAMELLVGVGRADDAHRPAAPLTPKHCYPACRSRATTWMWPESTRAWWSRPSHKAGQGRPMT
jgi:hypothetical protein